MQRLRRFFILLCALGYGFLGGGPSLWALGLAQPKPMPAACALMACTCKHGAKPKAGHFCCCRMQAKLAQKFKLAMPVSCEMRSKPCSPLQNDAQTSVPVQRPHVLVSELRWTRPSLPVSLIDPAFVRPQSVDRLSLERPPRS